MKNFSCKNLEYSCTNPLGKMKKFFSFSICNWVIAAFLFLENLNQYTSRQCSPVLKGFSSSVICKCAEGDSVYLCTYYGTYSQTGSNNLVTQKRARNLTQTDRILSVFWFCVCAVGYTTLTDYKTLCYWVLILAVGFLVFNVNSIIHEVI